MKQKDMKKHLPPMTNGGRNQRVGLLGGSFNPAHEGHVHISLEALERLQLDSIWWLVSPKNPLKDTKDLNPFETRVAQAEKLAKSHAEIQVTSLEQQTATNLTIDTLTMLKELCPDTGFIWLMGADNMVQFDQWAAWQDIVSLLPIAIFDRASYSTKALKGKLATEFASLRVDEKQAKTLGQDGGNGWVFLNNPKHPQSSTNIRDIK